MKAEKIAHAVPRESWDERIQTFTLEAKAEGHLETPKHLLLIDKDGACPWEIHVVDLETDLVVAYSSMKADFEQSLREFIEDYIA